MPRAEQGLAWVEMRSLSESVLSCSLSEMGSPWRGEQRRVRLGHVLTGSSASEEKIVGGGQRSRRQEAIRKGVVITQVRRDVGWPTIIEPGWRECQIPASWASSLNVS